MKYSQATNYALHIMLHFVALPQWHTITVQQLATFHDLSPTYLSKILAKLVKADLLAATPGIHGGYTLMSNKTDLTFLEVIQAIEGTASLFQGSVRFDHPTCLIQGVMLQAERQMEDFLKANKLIDLVGQHADALDQFVQRLG